MKYDGFTPAQMREEIRSGRFCGQTSGSCPGYAQANLVVLPKEYAYDFLLFAQRNPKACPLLEVTDTGSRFLKTIAPGAMSFRKRLPVSVTSSSGQALGFRCANSRKS